MSHECFVFYDDDYADNGGIGLERFDTVDQGLAFIENRLATRHARDTPSIVQNYTLIEGRRLELVAVSQVTKIGIVDRTLPPPQQMKPPAPDHDIRF